MNIEEAIKAIDNLKHEGNLVSLYAVKEIISQIKQEKEVIPQFVADGIELCKDSRFSLRLALSHWSMNEELDEWMEYSENQEIFAKAWLYGYEIEQEQLYTVEIPNPNIDKHHVTVLKRMEDGNIELCIFVRPDLTEAKFHLTEAEIRKDFEWAWDAGFAKKVED
ncbi:DUF1642 domain-containing protein [Streptococcus pluranimalium]